MRYPLVMRARGGGRLRVCLLALALLAAGLLAGCGGSSSTTTVTTSAVPSSSAASTQVSASSVDAVASVAGTPIAKATYEHWLGVERADGAAGDAGHRALGFLITSEWVLGEAKARGISVSQAEVKQHLAKLERQSFPKAGALRKFLASSHETEADLLGRAKVELLQSRIAALLTTGKSAAQHTSILARFQKAFQAHWKRHTTCKSGYVMEDCSGYKGKPEDLTVPRSSARSASSSAPSSSGSSASSPAPGYSASSPAGSYSGSNAGDGGTSASVEVSSRPGSFAIASPVIGSSGSIPARYTCDGAGISPPLQWSDVPANAAALVLLIVNTTAGPASGVRWIVGDIDPGSKGVGAGGMPEGGIVGSDSQGRSGYGGICPARGKTSTVQFVLYALSKKIPLTPGFQPSVAEREYNAGKLVLSQAAISYATYRRG